MNDSDYKNDNEAASGLAKVTNTVGRVLMSPINKWNSMAYYDREELISAAWISATIGLIVAAGVGVWNLAEYQAAKKEAAILQEIENITYEQVVDDGYGEYGATEMSAEDAAAIRAQAEKTISDARATSNWETVCFDSVAYIVEEKGGGKSRTKAITAKIDPDTLMPELCGTEAPKM